MLSVFEQNIKKRSGVNEIGCLFISYKMVKTTLPAGTVLFHEFTFVAHGVRDHPAGPADLSAAMHAVQLAIDGSRADALFQLVKAARLASASVEFPTVQFHKGFNPL